MPSAGTVEIDAANNDVAILDASDCALAATSSSLVSKSLLSSSSMFDGMKDSTCSSNSNSSNTVTQCSQESDMAESVNAAPRGGDNDESKKVEEEGTKPGSASQVSPMPQKRGATIVTPRSMRKAPPMTTTNTAAPSTSPSPLSSSGKGNNKGKPSSSSSTKTTNSDRKGNKIAAKKVEVAVDGTVNNVDSTTPTTPSSSSHPSTTSSSSSSGAAVATPGGDDSAIKKKKPNELPKKPKTTLHSFFLKVDPSAKKKEDAMKVDVKNVEEKNFVEEKRENAKEVDMKGSSSDSGVNRNKVEMIKNESTSSTGVEVPVVEKSVTDPKETATKKEKAPAKEKVRVQPQGGKATSKMKTNDPSTSLGCATSSSSTTSGRKPAVKMQWNEEEENLDDSPTFAVAAALRMVNHGRRGKSRQGGPQTTDLLTSTDQKATESLPSEYPLVETMEKNDRKSSSFPDTVVKVCDVVINCGTTIAVGSLENVRDLPLANTNSFVGEPDIVRRSEESSELDENPADNDADTNDKNNEEVTLRKSKCAVENSLDTSTSIDQQTVCIVDNSTTCDCNVESCNDIKLDDSVKEPSVEEVKIVEELKNVPSISAQIKPTSTKLSTKSRKQKNSVPATKPSNAKAATEASDRNGAASIPKQSVISPTTQISPSTPTKVSSKARSENASSSECAKLSSEDASRLHQYLTLRVKYAGRATQLGHLPSSDAFEEENLCLEGTLEKLEKGSVEIGEDGSFPDKLLTHLQVMTQGSPQPLSVLAKRALDELSPYITDLKPLTIESISSKIKLLAQRKSYLSRLPTDTFEKSSPRSKLDCFENAEDCYMWRWELCSLDLLPQPESVKVKKARTMRKKLQSHYKAIINLITATDKAIQCLQGRATLNAPSVGATLAAKVSEMEEKVLKFEREEERTRLLKEAEFHKLKAKAEELAEKQLEKERIEEERRIEKKRLEEEKLNEKRRRDEERELKKAETNRIKNEEKEKKKLEMEEKENKRKARMMMFFSNDKSKKKAKVSSISVTLKKSQNEVASFDNDEFRKLIESQGNQIETYSFAKVPRHRKTAKVRVSVFVTVLSENAFAPQPYDEERVIVVPNRYKFLGFHEDVRPPYRGTWSKQSSIVTGRRPLGKDTKYLDYDIDSEEEWEEGDDEDGEDLVDGDDGVEEEEDLLNEDDNDGWLAAEDDLGVEDDDDETRELRKKNLCNEAVSLSGKRNNFKACVVAPCMGGLPHNGFDGDNVHGFIDGFTPEDAMDVIHSHVGYIITPDVSICLDAFPPPDAVKDINQPNPSLGKAQASQNKEMTLEAQKIMAIFVHNSTLTSRDIVVTELLKSHPSLTNSRAQAVRELDVIAAKRRLANGAGVLWEVKAEHLNKLELNEKDLKQPPKEASPPSSPVEEGKTKKVKDPNAPKRNASAYLLYSNAARNDVRDANPNAGIADINKVLSENFKALPSEERAVWDMKAAVDKERYSREMAKYLTEAELFDNKSVAAEAVVDQDVKVQATVAESLAKSCTNQSSAKKRKTPLVSKASADLLAKFMKKKQRVSTEIQNNSTTQLNRLET